jgi:hypothetical protein
MCIVYEITSHIVMLSSLLSGTTWQRRSKTKKLEHDKENNSWILGRS